MEAKDLLELKERADEYRDGLRKFNSDLVAFNGVKYRKFNGVPVLDSIYDETVKDYLRQNVVKLPDGDIYDKYAGVFIDDFPDEWVKYPKKVEYFNVVADDDFSELNPYEFMVLTSGVYDFQEAEKRVKYYKENKGSKVYSDNEQVYLQYIEELVPVFLYRGNYINEKHFFLKVSATERVEDIDERLYKYFTNQRIRYNSHLHKPEVVFDFNQKAFGG